MCVYVRVCVLACAIEGACVFVQCYTWYSFWILRYTLCCTVNLRIYCNCLAPLPLFGLDLSRIFQLGGVSVIIVCDCRKIKAHTIVCLIEFSFISDRHSFTNPFVISTASVSLPPCSTNRSIYSLPPNFGISK